MKRREVVKLWTVVEEVLKSRLCCFSQRLGVTLCPAVCCPVSPWTLHLSAPASASPPSAGQSGCLRCPVPGQSPPGRTLEAERGARFWIQGALSKFKQNQWVTDSAQPSRRLHSHFFAPVIEEIVWFDVSVNDSKLVDVSQSFQQVVDVEANFFKAH